MAEFLEKPLPETLSHSMEQTKQNLELMWDEQSGQYYSRNLRTSRLVREPSIATLMPLYAGSISKKRANQLVNLLKDKKLFNTPYLIPSVPLNSSYFQELRYWQGPTWVNTNWLIVQGLERYGFKDEARHVRQQTLELVRKNGCYEYFSPLTSEPAGAKNFSWTAALAIDMAQD